MMTADSGFFSREHLALLNVATWAKYLSWVALVISLLAPVGSYVQADTAYLSRQCGSSRATTLETMAENPTFAASVIADVFYSWLKGFVFFLVLRAIALGLNMIVETDVNYREQRSGGVQDEQ